MPMAAPPEPTKGVIRIPKPPPGSRPAGQTAHGQPLYEREIVEDVRDENGNIVREPVLGPDGQPIWIKHPTTGAFIRQRMKNKTHERTQRFFIHVHQNARGVATGTHEIVEYTDQMEQEMRQAGRRRDSAEYMAEVFARAQARGLSPDEVLDRLDAPERAERAPQIISEHKPDPDQKYPRWSGPKTGWELSNGAYLERLPGEEKDAYKARATAAEVELNST